MHSEPRSTLYFGYGSNLLAARLEHRLGPCVRLGAASLPGYALRFHKRGRDGSGKCDAFHTGDPTDRLWGGVFRLDDRQLAELDRIEGPGYERATVAVILGGRLVGADLYVARLEARAPGLAPYDWYKEFVLAGACELALPRGYRDAIGAVPSLPDPGRARAARNHLIGRSATPVR